MRFVCLMLAVATMATSAAADTYLLFGATRNTGLDVAKTLVERGDSVTAVVRESSDTAALQELGVTLVMGDALDPASVTAAFASAEFDAVVSTMSGGVRNTAVDSDGHNTIIDAAKAAGVNRMVLVSAIGAGGTEEVLEPGARRFLAPVLAAKTVSEDYLRASGLDWTILRPGQLPDGPATGTGMLSEDQTMMGRITRGELAALVVQCLDDPATIGKVYHAVDAEMVGSFSSFD